MIKTSISIIIILSVAVALGFFYFSEGLAEGLCNNKVYKEYPSPNNVRKAVVFQRECGPSSGATTQVSIVDVSKALPNEAGNVLVMMGDPKAVAPKLEWKSESEVLIHRLIDGKELRVEKKLELGTPIEITYKGK